MAADNTPVFVPGFLEDIFISYAHRDEGSERWVSTFRCLLKEKVEYELQEEARVWSDSQLSSGDVLDATLKKRIQNTAVLVSIISHWYFEREWCQREVNYFLSGAEANGGLLVDTKLRFIPIIKREADNWPRELRELNPVSPYFCRGDATYPPVVEGGSDFHLAVSNLARDLSELLREMKKESDLRAQTQTILVLAPMSGLRSKEYDHLRNWLKGKHCIVRPAEELPRTREGIIDALEEELKKSRLVIHLLGPGYDMIPTQGRDLSVEALAFETVRKSRKRQVVWPGKEDCADDAQRRFLEHVKSLRDDQTEVVAGEFSEFLEALPEELDKSARKQQVRDQGIYLICDKSDLSERNYEKLRSHLIAQRFPLTLPSFEGTVDDLRALEEEQILSHDLTLIYYGTASDSWAERKRMATRNALLKKSLDERPKRALYVGPPDHEGLKIRKYGPYLGHEMPEIGRMFIFVLGGTEQFRPSHLDPFLTRP